MLNIKRVPWNVRLKASIGDILTNEVKYNNLLEKIRFHFECEDALRTVYLRLARGKTTIGTYRELAIWAGKIESELRKECA